MRPPSAVAGVTAGVQTRTLVSIVAGASLTAAMSLGQIGLTFCIPVFLQSVRGLDALHTGYALLPLSAALLVTAPLGGYLAAHVNPKRLVQAGLFISVVGLVFLRHTLNATTTSVDLIAPLAIYAAGLGLSMSQLGNITMSAVSVNQAGEASGVNKASSGSWPHPSCKAKRPSARTHCRRARSGRSAPVVQRRTWGSTASTSISGPARG